MRDNVRKPSQPPRQLDQYLLYQELVKRKPHPAARQLVSFDLEDQQVALMRCVSTSLYTTIQ
eukprot:3985495-Pleurochrysis_carterae.AAC.5